ncbi:hypothetical protein SAMN06265795_11967 [Noviherbaspirillum humi]|uniref:Uncharacterized protein n=1 Tax=Noviherbaspirillum humi TaxID=1688639 RepID=A0A239L6Z1_9BURK|nr:hypothetical protein [Noviherbaspirillum humi]SNT25623.1 hypothetical protein SAMN06265795_11967 [Noviherbaspirillum humi]
MKLGKRQNAAYVREEGPFSQRSLLMGTAAGVAVFIGLSLLRRQHNLPRDRRYGDRLVERRNPLNLFPLGSHPRRRRIDLSGTHPLFERRASAYEAG